MLRASAEEARLLLGVVEERDELVAAGELSLDLSERAPEGRPRGESLLRLERSSDFSLELEPGEDDGGDGDSLRNSRSLSFLLLPDDDDVDESDLTLALDGEEFRDLCELSELARALFSSEREEDRPRSDSDSFDEWSDEASEAGLEGVDSVAGGEGGGDDDVEAEEGAELDVVLDAVDVPSLLPLHLARRCRSSTIDW